MTAITLLFALSSNALACGGFFCGPQDPVDQAGEEIFFHVGETGRIEMHVQIEYEGPAEEFAWVLPVPNLPELDVGTDALFDTLSGLRARFALDVEFDGCTVPTTASAAFSSPESGGYDGGVTVVTSGAVGPYATVTLQATDSGELMSWLTENGFSLPASTEPLLQPYVSSEAYFVALKLLKDKDAGDTAPLVMRFDGEKMGIPIQLTSIAATPDMRLRVYVAGEHRAVPESYLHVQLNEAAIDWWTLGANLEDAITRSANEAGGHSFFTDYSGSPAAWLGQVHQPSWDAVLDATTDARSVLESVVDTGLPVDDPLLNTLAFHLGIPAQDAAGIDVLEVLNCLSFGDYGQYYGYDPTCFEAELAALTIDAALLEDDLEAVVLGPRRHAESLLGGSRTITRMTSSISPVEMTIDPTFVFNPDMGEVEQLRVATERFVCTGGDLNASPSVLELSDGRQIVLPSRQELARLGMTPFEWMESQGLTVPTNLIIEQTGPSGQPEILVDNRSLLEDVLESLNSGCGGCHNARVGLGTSGWILLGLLLMRRRR